jgi:hypothetical protein
MSLSFLIWMGLFDIYRYLIAAELLLPLAIWIMLHWFFSAPVARRAALGILILAIITVLAGFGSWGHKPWGDLSFNVELPELLNPDKTTILLVGGSPMGWMVPFFPASVVFVSVAGNFPEKSYNAYPVASQDIQRYNEAAHRAICVRAITNA